MYEDTYYAMLCYARVWII